METRQFKRALVVLSVTLVAVGSAAGAGEPYSETVDLSYPMSATGKVSLDNINGDVRVEVWEASVIETSSPQERAQTYCRHVARVD